MCALSLETFAFLKTCFFFFFQNKGEKERKEEINYCIGPPFQQAYDQHLNMMLGDVEETATYSEVDPETSEEIVKVRHSESFLSSGLTSDSLLSYRV